MLRQGRALAAFSDGFLYFFVCLFTTKDFVSSREPGTCRYATGIASGKSDLRDKSRLRPSAIWLYLVGSIQPQPCYWLDSDRSVQAPFRCAQAPETVEWLHAPG